MSDHKEYDEVSHINIFCWQLISSVGNAVLGYMHFVDLYDVWGIEEEQINLIHLMEK